MKPRTTGSGASARAPSLGRWTMCGRGIKKVAEMRMIEAVRAAITEEMERDERVLVMGEDVGRTGGGFGATDGLYARFGEARVLDTPLPESPLLAVPTGATFNGLHPFAHFQPPNFTQPPSPPLPPDPPHPPHPAT